MKKVVVTFNFCEKNIPGMQCGMNVFDMEGLTKASQWNDMMYLITQARPDIDPKTICVLYTKELTIN